MITQFFLLKIGETNSKGPLSESETRHELLHIDLNAWYIWKDGMADWMIASQCPEVLELLKPSETDVPIKNEIKETQFVRQETLDFDQTSPGVEMTPALADAINCAITAMTTPTTTVAPAKVTPIASVSAPVSAILQQVNSASGSVDEIQGTKKNKDSYSIEELNRRKHLRVPLRLSAVIRNSERAFVTSTRNVSLGGLLLTHSIPEYILNTECEIFLVDRQKNIGVSFKCIPIPDDGVRNRFQFEIKEHKHLVTLAKWLDEQVLSLQASA